MRIQRSLIQELVLVEKEEGVECMVSSETKGVPMGFPVDGFSGR